MEIKTRIFHRVVEEAREEAREEERQKGIKAIADTMEETVRFEALDRGEKEAVALQRINGEF